MNAPTHFPEVAATLVANGYRPVPIKPGTKFPGFDDWQHFKFAAGCETRYADHGAGVLLGDVVALDIDVDDPDAAAAVENAAREILGLGDVAEIPRRIGRAPRVLLPLRCSQPFHKIKSAAFKLRSNGELAHVEILAEGQQFVAYGTHPDTRRPYSWNGDGDLLTVRRDQLPEVNEGNARDLIRVCEAALEEWGERVAEPADKKHGATPGPKIVAGERNEVLFKFGCKLARGRFSVDEIEAALLAMNATRCDPPLETAEVATIAKSSGKYAPEAEPALPLIWAKDAGPMLDAPYVIKGVIGPGELIVIYGVPKGGKTFFTTDLSLHVSAGLPWFGHRVGPAGLVLYVASEMGKRAERRAWAWRERHLGDQADHDLPFAIVPKVVNLLNDVDVEMLLGTLESLISTRGPPVLIVFDTLARSMAGGDENSAQDMGRAVAIADRLRDQFGTATVLVHHAGKDVTKGSRGSSALLGAADCYILVDGDPSGNHVATVEWCRDGEAGRRHGFRLHQVELGTDSDGDTATTCVVVPSAEAATKPVKPVRRDVAFEALRETLFDLGATMPETSTIPKGVKAVTLDQWRARWALRTGYESSTGNSIAANFHKDKDTLLKAGKVAISKPYVWTTE